MSRSGEIVRLRSYEWQSTAPRTRLPPLPVLVPLPPLLPLPADRRTNEPLPEPASLLSADDALSDSPAAASVAVKLLPAS